MVRTGKVERMMDDPVATARRWFAEELRYTAGVRSPAVVLAFATVPRERFAGPGPWRVLSPMSLGAYWTPDAADPRHLYHDVLVAIDEERRLNKGQPSLWAALYYRLRLVAGMHVVHVGAGTGYYKRDPRRDRRPRGAGHRGRDRPLPRRAGAGEPHLAVAAGDSRRGRRLRLPLRPAGGRNRRLVCAPNFAGRR
jgi:hypothetical protein